MLAYFHPLDVPGRRRVPLSARRCVHVYAPRCVYRGPHSAAAARVGSLELSRRLRHQAATWKNRSAQCAINERVGRKAHSQVALIDTGLLRPFSGVTYQPIRSFLTYISGWLPSAGGEGGELGCTPDRLPTLQRFTAASVCV